MWRAIGCGSSAFAPSRSGISHGGAVELRTSVGRDDDAVARAVATLDPSWSWRTEDVSTVAAETWRDFAAPNWIADDLVIVPAWLELDVPRVRHPRRDRTRWRVRPR